MVDLNRPLVLAVHGTRSVVGIGTLHALRDAVAAALPSVPVRLGWVDLHEPPLVDTLASLRRPVVVPCFMASGYHVGVDIPQAVTKSGTGGRVTNMIGPDLIAAVADRVRERPGCDGYVLAAAGSRWPVAALEVAKAGKRLSTILARPVLPGYLTAASPSVTDAVVALRASGCDRVGIAPYLLAPGEFLARLQTADADEISDPIGVHPQVVTAVVKRYRTALAPQPAQSPGLSWSGSPTESQEEAATA